MHRVPRNELCPCGSGKKYKKCCLSAENRAETAPTETERIKVQAFKTMSEEKWADALALFRSIEIDNTEPFSVFWPMAACCDALEDYAQAAELYEKALAVCPPSRRFDVLYQLGIARGCGGFVEKAVEAFRECLELQKDPQGRERLERIIDVLEAIRLGRENPNLFRVRVGLQRVFSSMEGKRYQEAATRLEKLLSLDDKNPAIFYNLGVVYTFLRREEEAASQYEKAVQLNPDYVQAWYNLGQICLLAKKDFSKALYCFQQALAIRPDYVGAHHQKGVALELLGDRDKALECWEKTLQLDPGNKLALENIERVGRKTAGQPDPAIA